MKQRSRNGKPYGRFEHPPMLVMNVDPKLREAFKTVCYKNQTLLRECLLAMMGDYVKKHAKEVRHPAPAS
jgi:hypothetical protein